MILQPSCSIQPPYPTSDKVSCVETLGTINPAYCTKHAIYPVGFKYVLQAVGFSFRRSSHTVHLSPWPISVVAPQELDRAASPP